MYDEIKIPGYNPKKAEQFGTYSSEKCAQILNGIRTTFGGFDISRAIVNETVIIFAVPSYMAPQLREYLHNDCMQKGYSFELKEGGQNYECHIHMASRPTITQRGLLCG